MLVFIRQFIYAWVDYPMFSRFWKDYDRRKRFSESHPEAKFPKSRFDYAFTHAKICWSHRDMYGRKCRKYHGDCENCNAKHC